MNTKANILLTDDDKFLLDMYTNKFVAQGYNVEACLCAEDALKVLRSGYSPDVILFDLLMPERDGFSFLHALHDEHLAPNALYIALLNHNDETEKAKVQELGVQTCLTKASMIPSEVVNTVSEALTEKRSQK